VATQLELGLSNLSVADSANTNQDLIHQTAENITSMYLPSRANKRN